MRSHKPHKENETKVITHAESISAAVSLVLDDRTERTMGRTGTTVARGGGGSPRQKFASAQLPVLKRGGKRDEQKQSAMCESEF